MMNTAELSGIRVWRGYRSESLLHKRQDFTDKLKTIFIPQTAQQMYPLGLQAYFPAILPETFVTGPADRSDLLIPDEVALVVYPSDEAYKQATQKSVAGRAYGLLHSTVFNFSDTSVLPRSTSDTPVPWQEDWHWDQSLALIDEPIDWQRGMTSVLLARPTSTLSPVQFCRALNDIVSGWREAPRQWVDGSVLCVNRHWLLYWEHQQLLTGAPESESLMERLSSILDTPYIAKNAKLISVPPIFTNPDNGVDCEVGELLSVCV